MLRSSKLRRWAGAWLMAGSWLVCLGSASAAQMPRESDDGLQAPEAKSYVAPQREVLSSLMRAERPCSSATLGEAVQLIYEHDAPEQALALAQHCAQEAHQQGHAFKRLIAVRIQALLAMRFRDMATLHQAGQALVHQRVLPEYVPDGHMCLAFSCLASGDTQCARTHLHLARTQFTALQIPQALSQLAPLEQALSSMEDADPRP